MRRPLSWRLLCASALLLVLAWLPLVPAARCVGLCGCAGLLVASWVARWLEGRAQRRDAAERARWLAGWIGQSGAGRTTERLRELEKRQRR